MSQHRALAIGGAIALCALGGAACSRKPSPVAHLLEGQGTVEREHVKKLSAAPNGEPFVVGDAARTGAAAWARLRLRGGAVMRMGADTRVRFVAGGARLELGDASAEDAPVTIITEAGAAIIERGGVLRATDRDGNTRLEVVFGRAVIQGQGGEVALEPGGGLVVAIGGAIIERITPPAKAPVLPSEPPPTIAPPSTLTATVTGRGVTSRTGAGPWQPLPAGAATLAPGTIVKLPRGAGLTLARGDDRAAFIGAGEITVGDVGSGPVATASAGRARLQAGAGEVALAVPGGVIITRAGSDAIVDIGRADSRARVERGEVTLDGTISDATAAAGETGVLERGGVASLRDRTPATIDVALAAGERATIHDPIREVAVRIAFGDACPGAATATLEVADSKGSFADPRRIAGTGGAAFFCRAGTTRVRVRCPDGTVARVGSVRVVGDTGAAPVVRPGSFEIDTNGQHYGVTYQNRVPALDIGWHEASGATTLHVKSGAGAERTFTATGVHHLPAGTLDDGRHTVWITAGARTSPQTAINIAFDNAAPTAQIIAPPPRAAWSDPLLVKGVTVEGWSVAVEGQAAERDASGRFHVEIAVGAKKAIAIRIAHPQHGVDYYLRRRE